MCCLTEENFYSQASLDAPAVLISKQLSFRSDESSENGPLRPLSPDCKLHFNLGILGGLHSVQSATILPLAFLHSALTISLQSPLIQQLTLQSAH